MKHTMKRTILLAAALSFATSVAAQDPQGTQVPQQAGRIHRTQVVPNDTRHDAQAGIRTASGYSIEYTPAPLGLTDSAVRVGQVVEIPYIWTDGNVYLHLEGVGSAYTLRVNGQPVATVEDSSTPAEFALTPYIRQGKNAIELDMRHSTADAINATPPSRKAFEGSYLYYQNKRSIRDFELALVPDSTRRFGVLELNLIVQNSFNYDEPLTVGYDIYSPEGKLLEFNVFDLVLTGRSVDTLRFSHYIYHTYEHKWEAGGKTLPPLYNVMLFTKRDGAYKEYMPLKVGFGKTELIDGQIMRLGKQIKPVTARYNAAADPKTTRTQLLALKAQGKNTVTPDYPQPDWFYALCDQVGLYVIDRANINAPEKRTDRTLGGTPSNDPALADEFVERVKAMYYRSRNHTCVIAYALGNDSGNGYNMYKAYQWLKGVEKSRPVIYEAADGEWNTDL